VTKNLKSFAKFFGKVLVSSFYKLKRRYTKHLGKKERDNMETNPLVGWMKIFGYFSTFVCI